MATQEQLIQLLKIADATKLKNKNKERSLASNFSDQLTSIGDNNQNRLGQTRSNRDFVLDDASMERLINSPAPNLSKNDMDELTALSDEALNSNKNIVSSVDNENVIREPMIPIDNDKVSQRQFVENGKMREVISFKQPIDVAGGISPSQVATEESFKQQESASNRLSALSNFILADFNTNQQLRSAGLPVKSNISKNVLGNNDVKDLELGLKTSLDQFGQDLVEKRIDNTRIAQERNADIGQFNADTARVNVENTDFNTKEVNRIKSRSLDITRSLGLRSANSKDKQISNSFILGNDNNLIRRESNNLKLYLGKAGNKLQEMAILNRFDLGQRGLNLKEYGLNITNEIEKSRLEFAKSSQKDLNNFRDRTADLLDDKFNLAEDIEANRNDNAEDRISLTERVQINNNNFRERQFEENVLKRKELMKITLENLSLNKRSSSRQDEKLIQSQINSVNNQRNIESSATENKRQFNLSSLANVINRKLDRLARSSSSDDRNNAITFENRKTLAINKYNLNKDVDPEQARLDLLADLGFLNESLK